jgi:hypothetical protein
MSLSDQRTLLHGLDGCSIVGCMPVRRYLPYAAATSAVLLALASWTLLPRAPKQRQPNVERPRSAASVRLPRQRAETSAHELPAPPEPEAQTADAREPTGSTELSGRVLDALGGAVPFARVTFFQSAGGAALGALTADVNGRFKARLPPGNVCVQARALAFARALRCAQAPGSGVELVLPPAAEIVGRVIPAGGGAGIGGVTITAHSVSRGDDWVDFNQEPPRAVVSGPDGHFRVGELRGTGAYELLAKSEHWRSMPTQIQLDVGQTSEPLLLEVSPASALHVSVLRAGEACEGAEVSLSGPVGVVARTESNGEAHVPGLPSGHYTARVYCPGAVLHLAEFDIGAEALSQRWDLESGLAIEGLVLSPRGAPAAAARVSVVPASLAEGLVGSECVSDTDGAFVCSGLRAGDYECRVDPGDASHEVVHVSLVDGATPPRVVLHQRPKGTLIASLGAGRSQSDAVDVFARGPSGFPLRASRRGADFVFESVPLGVYQVYAELPTSGTVEAVLGRDAEVVHVELAVPVLSSIAGHVVDADGVPLPETWVVAQPSDSLARPGAAHAPVLSNAEGAFVVPRLAAGQYHVRTRSSYGTAELWGVATGEAKVVLRVLPEPALAGVDSQPMFGWIPAGSARPEAFQEHE